MANNKITLKTNIYFTAVLFSVYFVILILFSYFFTQRYRKIEDRKKYTEIITRQTDELNHIKYLSLAKYQLNSGITPEIADELLTSVKKTENVFNATYNELIRQKYIQKNEEIIPVCDSLKKSFRVQSVQLTNLISALQESSSLMESIINSGNNLITMAETNQSDAALIESQHLATLGQQQVFDKNRVYKDLISEKAAQVKNVFSLVEPSDVTGYSSEIDQILSDCNAIYNIYSIIGFKNNSGIINVLETERTKSKILLINVNDHILGGIKHQKIFLSILFLALLLFFLLIIINYYLRGSITFVVKPIEAFHATLEEMVMGKIPGELRLNPMNNIKILGDNINRINEGIRNKAEFAKNLNNGLIDGQLDLLSEEDILGTELISLQENLKASAEERRKHDEENERRRYINEGLARFSEITHAGYDRIEKLTDLFIRELVKYLNCLQGGIFLMNEDVEANPVLHLTSAFAYNRKKYVTKDIPVGEGLVGTCALEKKTILLSEIPEDYMYITSGLGDAPPRYLLLVPMVMDDIALGVIEVASLNAFKDYEIEFFEQVSISLAATITTTRINERTAKLLEQSTVNAQQMAEQEEEMRQNMEELKATQEESARREEEFMGTVSAISRIFFTIEFNLEGELIHINEKLLIFLGKSFDDVLGKTFPEIVDGKEAGKINKQVFENLKNGKNHTYTDLVKVRKREYHIQFSFIPVLNRDGLPVKVFCLGIELKS